MAFHHLVIVQEKTPDDFSAIMKALSGLHKGMTTTANYSKTDDRIKNIDKTTGLIQRYFIRSSDFIGIFKKSSTVSN